MTESPLFIRLYFDEDVSVFVAQLLRPHGFEILTTREAKNLGCSDDLGLAMGPSIRESELIILRFQIKYKTGITISVKMVELTMPPIMGAAIRFMTSAPVPVVHMIGSNPPMIAATVTILGRTR